MAIKFKFCFLNRHFALGLGRHLPLRRLPTTHSIFIVFVVQYVLGIHKAVNPLAAEKNLEAGILDSCVGSHKVTFMYVYVHAGAIVYLVRRDSGAGQDSMFIRFKAEAQPKKH
jgi:hypothetical protein